MSMRFAIAAAVLTSFIIWGLLDTLSRAGLCKATGGQLAQHNLVSFECVPDQPIFIIVK